jgi:hypothetical protein
VLAKTKRSKKCSFKLKKRVLAPRKREELLFLRLLGRL